MANEIEPYLRLAEEENPDMARSVARLRGIIWSMVGKGQFPREVRGTVEQPIIFHHPLFKFDASRSLISFEERYERLTLSEWKILMHLFRNINLVVTRQGILESLSEDGIVEGDIHLVNVHISHLRHKISLDRIIESPIQTVPGFGYSLVDPSLPSYRPRSR